jgi:hypothetical protein
MIIFIVISYLFKEVSLWYWYMHSIYLSLLFLHPSSPLSLLTPFKSFHSCIFKHE